MGKLSQEIGVLNEADELRALIDDCEKALAALGPDSARRLMLDADAAHRRLEQLVAEGADLRGEAARLGTIDERIVRSARPIVQSLGGTAELAALRQQIAPGTDARWWLLDHELDLRRQRLLRQIGTIVVVVAIVILAGYLARPILFPSDPVGDAVNAATRALESNSIPGAIAAIDSGLAKIPTSTELLIWKGILLEKSGNQQAGTASYQQALAHAESDRDFYLQRAIVSVRLGDYARVVTDTTTVIQKYPDAADAYYVRASGYDGLGERTEAIADLEKCADLAQASGNDALFAQARVRMGTLMQGGVGQ
jgi:tetratricopeptide (TPR) repeat protein